MLSRPVLQWAPASLAGRAGTSITLGKLTLSISNPGETLGSLTIDGLPAGAILTDGVNDFLAVSNGQLIDVGTWNLANLSVTLPDPGNYVLSAIAVTRDAQGQTATATATEPVAAASALVSSVTSAEPQGVAASEVASGNAGMPVVVTTGSSTKPSTPQPNPPQLPGLFSGYAVRPTWSVAGVDYGVGASTSAVLLNPARIAMAGVNIDATNHIINVTGSNVTLNGYDFTLGGGWSVNVSGANDIIENSSFKVGTHELQPITATATATNLTVFQNTIDGGGSSGTPGAITALIDSAGNGLTVEYNWLKNAPNLVVESTNGTLIYEYNLIQNVGFGPSTYTTAVAFGGGISNGSQFSFNTIYNPPHAGGLTTAAESAVQIEAQNGSTLTNTEVENNTIISPGPSTTNSYLIAIHQDPGANIVNGVNVQSNFLNFTGATAAYFPSTTASNVAFIGNVNLKTGAVVPGIPGTGSSNVSNVVTTPVSGIATAGETVNFAVTLNEPMFVSGAPTLRLSNGATAIYTGGSGTNKLTFTYTVAATDTALPTLAITQVGLPNGASIVDAVGDQANLAGALVTFGGLAIDPLGASSSVTWSPGAASGIEGSAIVLGTIAPSVPSGNSLVSLTVSAIPVGATLSDGTHSFTATTGSTSVSVAGWSLSALKVTPADAANFTLTVTATERDAIGDTSSATATKAVTVSPLAPAVTWSPASANGVEGSAIALGTIGATVNGLSGDGNTLQSLTVSAIPVGATLSDGTHSFTATTGTTSVSVAGWSLSALKITPAGDANFTLTVTATEQDAAGGTNSTSTGQAVNVSPLAPAVTWSPTSRSGVEGAAIALGTISATVNGLASDGNTLQSLMVGAIPAGATLSDGTHSFTATTGNTSVNIAGWSLSALKVTPASDANFALSVTATAQDPQGNTGSATASETVTVSPLAPTLSWSPASASGVTGSPIALGSISDTVNGLASDGNTLQSLTVSAIPVGATLSDGTHSFTATAGGTSVSVAGWSLSALKITPAAASNFALTVTATERDAAGDTSSATASETVTVTANAPSSGFVDGSANAPAGTPQLPTLLSGYAVRPPWEVAGVDYAVGVPVATTLKDPATISMAGVTVDTTKHLVTVTGNNVTLNGYDFGLANGWRVVVNGANDVIENSRFVVSASQGTLPNVLGVNSSASNFSLLYNEFDGGNIAVTAQVAATIGISSSGTLTIEYNYFHNSGGDAIDLWASTSPQVDLIEYNLFRDIGVNTAHADTIQWYNTQTGAGSDIGFNTVYQNVDQPGPGNGALVPLAEGPLATMNGLTVNNDTIIQTANVTHANFSVGFYADLGGTASNIVIHDIYVDPTGVMGYTGSPWFPTGHYGDNLANPTAMTNVFNMVTGAAIPVPSSTTKTSQGYYTYADASGISPALSDVYDVTASPSNGVLNPGDTVTLTLNMDEAFTVTGTPTLSLNSGGAATYSGGSGTNALTFAYKVGAADTTVSTLAVTRVNLPNGATVTDSVGNQANLGGALASFNGLAVDPPVAPITVTWSAGAGTGAEGSTITLGAVATNVSPGSTLQSLTISAIPVGAMLTDGARNFTATTGNTSVSVLGWTLSALRITPAKDANFSLTLTAVEQDEAGNTSSASTSQAVTVTPLAPTVTWSTTSATGVEGSAVALATISDTVAGLTGDSNSLQSLTVSAIPVGATLSDGTHSFTASTGNTSVNIAGWALSSLRTTPANDANFALTVTATEQDAEGNTSSASANQAVTVAPLAPTVTWSQASANGVAGVPIALGSISDTVNGLSGDGNTLQSLTVSGIPVGATLSDGTHSFTATTGNTSDNVTGWSLSTLNISATLTISAILGVTAVVQDAGGNTSSASASEAVTIGAPSAPSSIYPDGSANAPAGTPQLPNLFSGDAVRPPWEVAGVDYYVGVPSGTVLKDPSIPGSLPAGASLNKTYNVIIVTGNNVTINGFDFSGNGGYGIYIEPGVSGTRITNNLFVDSSPTGPIPVNIAAGASNTYIAYNTIDAGGANGNQSFDETIYNLGSGLTVEYNFIENAPGRFVTAGTGPLVYQFNLLENGGWLPGVHLNFLQFFGGDDPSPQINFNTLVQSRTVANGEGFQLYNNYPGSISNASVSNNTMISSPAVLQNGSAGPAISYMLHAGSNSQYSSPATGVVNNNYIDTSSAYGAYYPGLSGFTYSGNINLKTGATIP